jgi:hypothetical protein
MFKNEFRATVRNGNIISADLIEDINKKNTIRTTLVTALFRQFVSCFVVFDIAG